KTTGIDRKDRKRKQPRPECPRPACRRNVWRESSGAQQTPGIRVNRRASGSVRKKSPNQQVWSPLRRSRPSNSERTNRMIALADHEEKTAAADQPAGQRTIAELTKTVSASRLSTWQRCRLQFYFRYIAGIQKSPTPALHIGTTVHTVLQQWNLARWRGRQLEPQELEEIFSRAWTIWQDGEQIDWEGNEEAAKCATWDLIELYWRETRIAADEKPQAVEVGVEADLTGHGLPTLVGVIDLVRAGGRIVDFKTAARRPDVQLLAHTTETQTTSYGLL